ncbi:MAG: hypothetical protein LBL00_07365 [Endomicrobium sp.]|jgi:hypothetical protein|nr:hypothetical protein [Endomicrobium sp.]
MFKKSYYASFDKPFKLTSAKNNTEQFINNLPSDKLDIIDEVQLAKGNFSYLKI